MYFWKVYFPKAYQLSESVFSKGGIFNFFCSTYFLKLYFLKTCFGKAFFQTGIFHKVNLYFSYTKNAFFRSCKMERSSLQCIGPMGQHLFFRAFGNLFHADMMQKYLHICTLHSHTTHTTLITCWPHHRYKLLDHQRSCRTGNTAQK